MSTELLNLLRLWTRVRGKFFTWAVRGAFHTFGRNTTLQPPCRLAGEEHISVGSGVFLGPHCWLQVGPLERVEASPVIRLDDGVSMAGFCTVTAARSVIIEKQVLLARYVYISDHMHEHRSREEAILAQGISDVGAVRIRAGAWLGQSVVVCPGVTIGRNAVIGANSVVRRDVPDFCVAAGVPAKVIREVDRPRSS